MLRWCLLLLVSALSAVYGMGGAFRSELMPSKYPGEFVAIAADGWIANNSKISLPDLFPRGNFIKLYFDSWRPKGNPPAHIKVNLCGEKAAEFIVQDDDFVPAIALNGKCFDQLLEFEVVNPFRVSDNDTRDKGAKLVRAEISSKLRVPVVSALILFKGFAALFLLGGTMLFLGGRVFTLIGLLLPVLGSYILSTSQFEYWAQVSHLWAIFFLGLGGLGVGKSILPPETSEPKGNRFTLLALVLIFIFGAAIRFYGLQFGLPQQYHSDEPRKVGVIHRMIQENTWDPKYFLHPSLLIYSTMAMKKVQDLIGVERIPGTEYFVAGRSVSAVAGSLSILLLYFICTRLFDQRAGLLSALSLAAFPLHVTCSRYMKEDALLVFNLLLSMLFVVRAVQDRKVSNLFLASFFAGMCAASKYTGMLAVVPILYAPWLSSRSWKPDPFWVRWVVLSIPLVPLAFILCTPYSILNSAKFIEDFSSEQNHMETGHTSAIDAWSQYWMFHVINSLIPGMTSAVVVFSLVACGVLLWRRRVEDLLILGMILVFYLPAEWVKAKPAPQPDRYILPCLPFLAAAASGLVSILSARKWRILASLSILMLTILPAVRSIHLASEIRHDTRERMADWMRANIAPGSKILINGWGYSPQFSESEFSVSPLSRTKPLEFTVARLKEGGQEYVLLSSFVYDRYFEEEDAMRFMRERFKEIFSKLPLVHEEEAKYGAYGFHNPTLRLYSLKDEDINALRAKLQG